MRVRRSEVFRLNIFSSAIYVAPFSHKSMNSMRSILRSATHLARCRSKHFTQPNLYNVLRRTHWRKSKATEIITRFARECDCSTQTVCYTPFAAVCNDKVVVLKSLHCSHGSPHRTFKDVNFQGLDSCVRLEYEANLNSLSLRIRPLSHTSTTSHRPTHTVEPPQQPDEAGVIVVSYSFVTSYASATGAQGPIETTHHKKK